MPNTNSAWNATTGSCVPPAGHRRPNGRLPHHRSKNGRFQKPGGHGPYRRCGGRRTGRGDAVGRAGGRTALGAGRGTARGGTDSPYVGWTSGLVRGRATDASAGGGGGAASPPPRPPNATTAPTTRLAPTPATARAGGRLTRPSCARSLAVRTFPHLRPFTGGKRTDLTNPERVARLWTSARMPRSLTLDASSATLLYRTSPASVAQGIEHHSPKVGVAGSNPAGGAPIVGRAVSPPQARRHQSLHPSTCAAPSLAAARHPSPRRTTLCSACPVPRVCAASRLVAARLPGLCRAADGVLTDVVPSFRCAPGGGGASCCVARFYGTVACSKVFWWALCRPSGARRAMRGFP